MSSVASRLPPPSRVTIKWPSWTFRRTRHSEITNWSLVSRLRGRATEGGSRASPPAGAREMPGPLRGAWPPARQRGGREGEGQARESSWLCRNQGAHRSAQAALARSRPALAPGAQPFPRPPPCPALPTLWLSMAFRIWGHCGPGCPQHMLRLGSVQHGWLSVPFPGGPRGDSEDRGLRARLTREEQSRVPPSLLGLNSAVWAATPTARKSQDGRCEDES